MRAISIIRSPNEKGLPKIAGLRPRFLGKRRNSTAAHADCLMASRCNAGAVSTSAEGKTPSRKSGGCPSKSRHSAAPLREICVNTFFNNSLRAQKSHFLQAPPICRILAAQFGKSECAALLQGRAFKARGAERKTNAEPRFIAANIRLSLRSRKKVLSLSKLFS